MCTPYEVHRSNNKKRKIEFFLCVETAEHQKKCGSVFELLFCFEAFCVNGIEITLLRKGNKTREK